MFCYHERFTIHLHWQNAPHKWQGHLLFYKATTSVSRPISNFPEITQTPITVLRVIQAFPNNLAFDWSVAGNIHKVTSALSTQVFLGHQIFETITNLTNFIQ
uniref:Uncharacterized protein n=1 Tax=Rhizophora mucronata TaxID=61149 RepID=A0A2P2QVT7_RHIMU